MSLFDTSVHPRLVKCIADLLKCDLAVRLISLERLEHPYLLESVDRTRTHISLALSMSRPCLGTPLAFLPPFLNSRVHRMLPNDPPLIYLPTLQVSLKHCLHADNRSSHH